MINLQTIDLVIGLATVFLAVSLVCSSINEVFAAILSLRANTLRAALNDLLSQPVASKVIAHPAIPSAKWSNGQKEPAYIEPQLFATALLDEIVTAQPAPAGASLFAQASAAITGTGGLLAGTPAQKSVEAFLQAANGNYDKLHDQIAGWFDAYMDRVSGVYKQRSHQIATIIAVVVVVILNIDTLNVYRSLVTQPAIQAAVAQKATVLARQPAPGTQTGNATIGDTFGNLNKSIANLPIPIGWHFPEDLKNWWQKIVGLFITIVAASFGAPFWFGVLNRLTNIRSAGPSPNGSSS